MKLIFYHLFGTVFSGLAWFKLSSLKSKLLSGHNFPQVVAKTIVLFAVKSTFKFNEPSDCQITTVNVLPLDSDKELETATSGSQK